MHANSADAAVEDFTGTRIWLVGKSGVSRCGSLAAIEATGEEVTARKTATD